MPSAEQSQLKRTIGPGTLALNAINLTIGAGIFVVPAIVSQSLGPASFVAYLLCALLMILVMLCFAEIGSKITTSGGAYAYVEHAFGPYAGFLINILLWFGFSVVSDAAIANAMADMIGTLWPAINIKFVRIVFFILLFGFFCIVNIRGSKSGARLVVFNTIMKLVPLALLVLFGLFQIKGENLVVEQWPPLENYGEMALILFFAFGGSESALGNSGEIKNPQRSIPRGIFAGLFAILVTYLLIQTVAQGILGPELANAKEAPLAETAKVLFGPFGFYLILIGAIISIYGTLSGDVLSTSRIIYAGADDKIYPSVLAKLHPKFKTPAYAIILFSVLNILLASLGEFRQLALVSSSAILVVYFTVILATIKVRWKEKNQYPGAFKIPGSYVIPLLAAGVVLWFLSHISSHELIAMAVFFVIVSLYYWFYSRKKTRKLN